jgi:hypothetical protein
VRHSPYALVAVLLYLTLDLSLPSMPGAFVFDASDSVDIDVSSHHEAPAVAVTAERDPSLGSVRRHEPVRLALRLDARAGRPRSVADAPPPSEDPH